MSANQARFRVTTMARALGVSPSGYYLWCRCPASARAGADAALTAHVPAIHARSRGTYGAQRIHAELAAGGVAVSRKRVVRVMRAAGVADVSRRRTPRTTMVTEAPEMTVGQRRPAGVIHHSDQGCHYTSLAIGSRCR